MNSIKAGDSTPLPPAVSSTSQNDSRDPRMLEAARGFENQFLRQMVTEMRKTVPKDELIPDSMAENIFKEQLDNEYVDKWVDGGGVGLADIIYNQLNEKYGHVAHLPPKKNGETLPLPQRNLHTDQKPQDFLSKKEGSLFLARRQGTDFEIKSINPLQAPVSLHSPFSGLVLQTARLEDGRQMMVVKHDQGLVTKIVYNGQNRVKIGERVAAGDAVADLIPPKDGSVSKVLFGLRKAQQAE